MVIGNAETFLDLLISATFYHAFFSFKKYTTYLREHSGRFFVV
nr:MAG TPA: hypothetical protein [Caudoviricetes sp.]